MGIDIHIVAQVKVDGKWETTGYDITNYGRDYELFGLLAGSRGYSYPIKHPRGLPEDFEVAETDSGLYTPGRRDMEDERGYWMGDYGHSYYTLEELLEFYTKNRKKKNIDGMYGLRLLIANLIIIEARGGEEYEDNEVRVVFGFDS
jgi:hypothetical protein